MVSLLVMMSPCAQLYTTQLKLFGELFDRVQCHQVVPIDGVITCSGISLRYFTNV